LKYKRNNKWYKLVLY